MHSLPCLFIGGIKGFSSDHVNVTKWCLNRPQQALIMKHLLELSGLTRYNTEYKALRQTEVKRSEHYVSKVIDVLENDYLNPFSIDLECNEVYNLSSGKMYMGNVENLLNIWNQGKEEPRLLKTRGFAHQ